MIENNYFKNRIHIKRAFMSKCSLYLNALPSDTAITIKNLWDEIPPDTAQEKIFQFSQNSQSTYHKTEVLKAIHEISKTVILYAHGTNMDVYFAEKILTLYCFCLETKIQNSIDTIPEKTICIKNIQAKILDLISKSKNQKLKKLFEKCKNLENNSLKNSFKDRNKKNKLFNLFYKIKEIIFNFFKSKETTINLNQNNIPPTKLQIFASKNPKSYENKNYNSPTNTLGIFHNLRNIY